MIRINLLPRELRRRRLTLPRNFVVAASMLLGWALLMSAGYVWIAGHGAQAGRLRAQADEARAEAKRLKGQRDNPQLANRQLLLRNRREALARLRDERRGPLPALTELAGLLGGFVGEGEAPLRLVELRAASASTWRVVGTARDAAALGELMRRLEVSDRFDLAYGPEYARTFEDRLLFRVDLAVAGWE